MSQTRSPETALRIVGISGNPGLPSRTRVLTETLVASLVEATLGEGHVIDLSELGTVFGSAAYRRLLPLPAEAVLRRIEEADVLVVASPVYRGSYAGLFKHVFDLLGQDALAGKPVVLAATGGSERHALVIEHQLRPLFGFFRAQTVPTGVYASESDFDGYALVNPALRQRIALAVDEAANLAFGGARFDAAAGTPLRAIA